MSKLTKALIPGYGANPTKPTSNPLAGLAPDLETGLPQGLPSGVGKLALRASNPVGGIGPDVNGDIGYQKGWLDQSSNGTPDAAPKGPGYSVWGDPDITKRGWGWGMNSKGQLQTGTMGGGPAGTIWGPNGNAATGSTGATPAAGGTPPSPASAMSPQQGMQLAQRMRSMQTPQPAMPQQGPAMGAGGPQGQAGMGGQPGAPGGQFTQPQQFPPVTPGTPAYGLNQQGNGIQALIDQLRQQQPQQAQ